MCACAKRSSASISRSARSPSSTACTSSEHDEPFDQLVIATGAAPIRPDIPGVNARGVHGIQTITDGIELHDHVGDHDRAVVVGGGYIGLEMAEAMKKRGMDVTIVEAAPQPMSTLDPDMGALVADAIRRMDIELQTDTEVKGFETDNDDHVRAVVTERRNTARRHRRARDRRASEQQAGGRRRHRRR